MLTPAYAYLADEPAPKVLLEALKELGVKEVPGKGSNPTILQYAQETGLEKSYTDDDTAWCGLFIAAMVLRAGYQPVASPLWALNWQKFGDAEDEAELGDILVFKRKTAAGWAGHVGIYVGETANAYAVLGGNQGNKVSIVLIEKSRCVAIRRCPWKKGQPANVRRILVDVAGALSTNEA